MSSVTTNSNFTLDASQWDGNIQIGRNGNNLDASGDITVTVGTRAMVSSSDALKAEDTFVLDASNSVTAEMI